MARGLVYALAGTDQSPSGSDGYRLCELAILLETSGEGGSLRRWKGVSLSPGADPWYDGPREDIEGRVEAGFEPPLSAIFRSATSSP